MRFLVICLMLCCIVIVSENVMGAPAPLINDDMLLRSSRYQRRRSSLKKFWDFITFRKYRHKKVNVKVLKKLRGFPYEKIAIDIAQFRGGNYVVVIDYYSRWFDIIQTTKINSTAIISALKALFSTHGIPQKIVSHRRTFKSPNFQTFSDECGIRIIHKDPTEEDLINKIVGTARRFLRKVVDDGYDLSFMLLRYRTAPILSLGFSPSQLLVGRNIHFSKANRNLIKWPNYYQDYSTKHYLDKEDQKFKKEQALINSSHWRPYNNELAIVPYNPKPNYITTTRSRHILPPIYNTEYTRTPTGDKLKKTVKESKRETSVTYSQNPLRTDPYY